MFFRIVPLHGDIFISIVWEVFVTPALYIIGYEHCC